MTVLDPLGLSFNNAFWGSYFDAAGDPSDGWFIDPYDGTFVVTIIMPAVMDDAGGGRRCGPIFGWRVGWYGGCNRGAIGRQAVFGIPVRRKLSTDMRNNIDAATLQKA